MPAYEMWIPRFLPVLFSIGEGVTTELYID